MDSGYPVWCVPEYREPDRKRTLERRVSDVPTTRTCEHYKELKALREELSGT